MNYLRNGDAAGEVVEQINALGRRAVAVQADVGDPDQVGELFEQSDRNVSNGSIFWSTMPARAL